eukprot:2620686-Rhodomonas_salina.2
MISSPEVSPVPEEEEGKGADGEEGGTPRKRLEMMPETEAELPKMEAGVENGVENTERRAATGGNGGGIGVGGGRVSPGETGGAGERACGEQGQEEEEQHQQDDGRSSPPLKAAALSSSPSSPGMSSVCSDRRRRGGGVGAEGGWSGSEFGQELEGDGDSNSDSEHDGILFSTRP